MNILITSGGTKIPIDLVRSITNMSRGTFGSQICDSFWRKLHREYKPGGADRITFFHAKNSKMPAAEALHNETFDDASHIIDYIEYDTFDSYMEKLCDLLKREKFDIIVLAAAVSDYGVEKVFNGKYRSREDEMVIRLVKLPKVITEVRKLAPDSVICGFKLLVNSTDEELRTAMEKQFSENHIDLCIGNDLRDIKASNHRLTIKLADSEEFFVVTKQEADEQNKRLSDIVVEYCCKANS